VISWRVGEDVWYIPNHGDVSVGTSFINEEGDIFIILRPIRATGGLLQGFDVYLNGKRRFMSIRDIKHKCRILSSCSVSLPSSSEL